MEILISGLIIVALMAYVSTRIKRSAAAAFEAETIEGEGFTIDKPAGFLHNLNADPKYVFEAYSKEFSTEHPKFRVGTARITSLSGGSLKTVGQEITSKGSVIADVSEVIGERHYREISIDDTDGDISICRKYKLGDANDGVYRLEVSSLDTEPDPAWAETFIDSFRVK